FRGHIAELPIRAARFDQKSSLRRLVADALDNRAAVDVPALEAQEVNSAASAHLNFFGADGRCEETEQQCGGGSDHGEERPKVATRRHDTSLDSPVKVALTTGK